MQAQAFFFLGCCLVLLASLPIAFSEVRPTGLSLPIPSSSPGQLLRGERSSGGCFPGYPEVAMTHLNTCCWYDSSSCCTPATAPVIMPYVLGNLTVLGKTGISPSCYAALASVLCLSCSPNTQSFISTGTGGIQIRLCNSLCNAMFSACKADIISGKISNVPTTTNTGADFCQSLTQNDQRIIVASNSCFAGVPIPVVALSQCLPPMASDITLQTTTSSSSSSNDSLLGVLVGLTSTVVVLLFILLVAGVAVGGFLLWRRWNNGRTWLVNPMEDEDEIQMEEFKNSRPLTLPRSPSLRPSAAGRGRPVPLNRAKSQGRLDGKNKKDKKKKKEEKKLKKKEKKQKQKEKQKQKQKDTETETETETESEEGTDPEIVEQKDKSAGLRDTLRKAQTIATLTAGIPTSVKEQLSRANTYSQGLSSYPDDGSTPLTSKLHKSNIQGDDDDLDV
jgi:hypothetical protein